MSQGLSPQLEWRANEAGVWCNPNADAYEAELGRMADMQPDMFAAPRPRPTLAEADFSHVPLYNFANLRVGCIGAGAGGIALTAYMINRGLPPENATIIDTRPDGGIWNDPNVRFGGFNNPTPLEDGRGTRLSLQDRNGFHMLRFLRQTSEDFLHGVDRRRGRVLDIVPRAEGYTLATQRGELVDVDAVILAAGMPHPRQINGSRIASNLDSYEQPRFDGSIVVERHQRELGNAEMTSTRPIVLLGLGNSTAAMLHYIQRFEDRAGVIVNYTVLTDAPVTALVSPLTSVHGRKPIFRNPSAGYLTGYSGDIARDRASYVRAMQEGRVIPGVDFVYYHDDVNALQVEYAVNGMRRSLRIDDPQNIFALLGNEPDLSLVEKLKAPKIHRASGPEPVPTVRPNDGAVFTRERGYRSNIFAIGACAASPLNPNALVIPGIFGQAPSTTLTLAVRRAAAR